MHRKFMAVLAISALALTACGSTDNETQSPGSADTSEASKATDPVEDKSACEDIDSEAAIRAGFEKMSSHDSDWLDPITADPSVVDRFDACAPLEAVVLQSASQTENSPMAVILFHKGEFIAPTTSTHFPHAEVTRVDPNTMRVMYTVDRPGGYEGVEVVANISTYRWDDEQEKLLWAGQLPSHELSMVPISVEAFAGQIPDAVKAKYGENLPATALPMEYQIPSQNPELNMNWSDSLDAPQAAIASPGRATICNIAWDNMYCSTPGVEWPIEPLDLGGKTIANTHYHVLGPSTKADLDYGIEIGAVGGPVAEPAIELTPGEARYFNNFMCVSSGTDLTCWEALTGSGFIVDDGEFTAF